MQARQGERGVSFNGWTRKKEKAVDREREQVGVGVTP